MALSRESIRSDYPLPVYNYRVEIGDTTIACSSISGLNIGYNVTTFKQSRTETNMPGPKFMYMPAQIEEVTITISKGVVRKDSIPTLYGWLSTKRANVIEKRDIKVHLLDETGVAVVTWTVLNAFPTHLDAPSFDANSNDAAIETLRLRADQVMIAENG